MGVNYRHGVSILELIIYLPTFFVALWMAWRHGFKRSSGWVNFVIFSIFRIVGACCSLATINNPITGLYIATAVCNSIGLGPLLVACIGLLSRANDSIHRKTQKPLSQLIFKGLGILTLVCLILAIIGQTTNASLNTLMNPSGETKAGMILFLVTWVAICFLLLRLRLRYEDIEAGEHRLLVAVGLSLPFILVRLIYSLISAFAHDRNFNVVTGNVTAMLVMDVLEEFAVVFICLGIGLTLQVRPPITDVEQSDSYYGGYPSDSGRRGAGGPLYQRHASEMRDSSHRRDKNRIRKGGPITQLVMLAADEISARREGQRTG